MLDELLFLGVALVDMGCVFVAARLGRGWLEATILVNLLLVTVMGAGLVDVFGFVTNIGNVPYASAFLGTYFLIERSTKTAGLRIIGLGMGAVIFFAAIAFLLFFYHSAASVFDAVLLPFEPRIFFASILGYGLAQYLNIQLFAWMREKNYSLFASSGTANVLSQAVDSCIFFTIAFFNLPNLIIIQSLLLGFAIKSFVVALGIPFLYLDRYLSEKQQRIY